MGPVVIFPIALLLVSVSGYNLNDVNLTDGLLQGDRLFGWSMVHYQQDLYVGAPLSDKVLRCQSLASSPNCSEGKINPSSSSLTSEHLQDSWFGGSLAASGSRLYSCAFRYDWRHWPDGLLQSGKCYKKEASESRFTDYLDFTKNKFQVEPDGNWMVTGFFGVSATVDTDGHLVIGNPVQYSTWGFNSKPRYTVGSIGKIKKVRVSSGRVPRLFRARGDVGWARREGYNTFKYAGYDVSAGKGFLAVGAPKADNYRGKVYVCYDCFKETSSYLEVSGVTIGEHFGSSVTACDFTGDGRDDLVIGAPNYAKDRNSYDTGRAHVFIRHDFNFHRAR